MIRKDTIGYDRMIEYDRIQQDTIVYDRIPLDTIGYDGYNKIRYDRMLQDMTGYDGIGYKKKLFLEIESFLIFSKFG